MAPINSIRDFHNELATVCDSLESLFRLAGRDYREIESAAIPAMLRFRQLLDAADSLSGSDAAEATPSGVSH